LKHGVNVFKGYRSRNIDIAKAVDVLYDIEVRGNCRHCKGRGHRMVADYTYLDSSGVELQKKTCGFCEGTGAYSGGYFTLKEVRKLGKEVHQIIID